MPDGIQLGWFKCHRKLFESAVWQHPGLFRLWMYCLRRANYREAWVSVSGAVAPLRIAPGQFITGRYELHKGVYPRKGKSAPSPFTLWRWLETLQELGNLSIKTSNKYSIVTVVNWDTYQGNGVADVQVNVQQVSNRCATGEQQVSTEKEVKEVKKVKKKRTRSEKPSFTDDNLLTLASSILPESCEATADLRGWYASRADRKKPLTENIAKLNLTRIADYPPTWIARRLADAAANGWLGLHFPDDPKPEEIAEDGTARRDNSKCADNPKPGQTGYTHAF